VLDILKESIRKMSIKLEIIWCENKIIKLRIDNEDLWETTEIITNTEFKSQFIEFTNESELVSFSTILIKGLVTDLLSNYILIANKIHKKLMGEL
jgi:hypothetical protein